MARRQTTPKVYIGTAAPTTIPTHVGDFFLDTVNKKLYVSVALTSSSDWVILN